MFKIGADPELFAMKDHKPVSAYGLIRGNKKAPFKVNNGAVQVDGMALEFNIDPSSTEEEFIKNINSVVSQLKEMVPGYDVVAEAVAEFGEEYINSQPPEAIELGCDPDFNAWDGGQANFPPNVQLPFRTGAGHVHIGWEDNADTITRAHFKKCIGVAKQMDFFLGLPSLVFDKAVKRRTMYGKPGCFRPKVYGVEYRTLSNQWVREDGLKAWVFRNTQEGMRRYEEGDRVFERVDPSILANMMREEPNMKAVLSVIKDLNIELPKVA